LNSDGAKKLPDEADEAVSTTIVLGFNDNYRDNIDVISVRKSSGRTGSSADYGSHPSTSVSVVDKRIRRKAPHSSVLFNQFKSFYHLKDYQNKKIPAS
jgi:hypothetical protein